MRSYKITGKGLNDRWLQNVKNLVIFLSILALITACSGGAPNEQIFEQESETGLSLSVQDIPKQGKDAPKTAQVPAPQEMVETGGGGAPVEENQAEFPVAATVDVEPVEAQMVEPDQKELVVPTEIPTATPQVAQPSGIESSLAPEPKVGHPAPDFTLTTLDGVSVQLAALVGKPLLINYWATWCVPCQQELVILSKLFTEYQERGFQIVSINAIEQDSMDKVITIVSEKSLTFPVLLDHGDKFSQNYQAIFFPTTIFVDANGIIREIKYGDSSETDLRAKIEMLLSGGL